MEWLQKSLLCYKNSIFLKTIIITVTSLASATCFYGMISLGWRQPMVKRICGEGIQNHSFPSTSSKRWNSCSSFSLHCPAGPLLLPQALYKPSALIAFLLCPLWVKLDPGVKTCQPGQPGNVNTPPCCWRKQGLRKALSRKTFCSQGITWEEENSWEQGNIQQRAGEMGSWDRSFPGASQHKALIWKKGMQMSRGMEQQGDE